MSRMEEICEFETKLDETFEAEGQWQVEATCLLEEWKKEYRKNCKI